MSDDLPLSRVHDVSTELEIRFKQAAPELFKVLIHPEPQTDNRNSRLIAASGVWNLLTHVISRLYEMPS